MNASGIGRFHIVKRIMNAAKYITILQKLMISLTENLISDKDMFQDKKHQRHSAKVVFRLEVKEQDRAGLTPSPLLSRRTSTQSRISGTRLPLTYHAQA
jgi:hypothetical protein